jgi:hypothetical protein
MIARSSRDLLTGRMAQTASIRLRSGATESEGQFRSESCETWELTPLDMRRNPLTPALSPLRWGEGDGAEFADVDPHSLSHPLRSGTESRNIEPAL